MAEGSLNTPTFHKPKKKAKRAKPKTAKKAKAARPKTAKKAKAAQPKANQRKEANGMIDESALTKGELRKLNALRKSVGEELGEKTFADWLKAKSAGGSTAPVDKNAELIAETLFKLIEDKKLKMPRGGYLVTRGRGRVIVEQPIYG